MASPVKKSFDAKTATSLLLVMALGATVGSVGAALLSNSDVTANTQQVEATDSYAYYPQTEQPSRDSWIGSQPQTRSFGFTRGS